MYQYIEGKPSEWRKLLDVNVIALTQCAVEAVQSMRKRGITHGQIINITRFVPFLFLFSSKFG